MTLQYQQNADLAPFNGLAIPALGQRLVSVSSVDHVLDAIQYARQNRLRTLVLGEGSNTVFRSDFAGLVILNRLSGMDVLSDDADEVRVKVAAGENWHAFVETATRDGWFGLENLALIPGLVGAAPIQNIGAYGVEVEDCLLEVEYVDIETSSLHVLHKRECEFSYRDSVFKHALKDKTIITSVTFRLNKRATCHIHYPGLAEALPSQPTPQQVFDAVCRIRTAKLPLPVDIPNVGSFFKNPIIGNSQYDAIKQRFPTLVSYTVPGGYKLAAGWLIEQAGWKEKNHNGVRVHSNQALVITNPERRTGTDVLAFARQIQRDVEKKFGVNLEIEPRIY